MKRNSLCGFGIVFFVDTVVYDMPGTAWNAYARRNWDIVQVVVQGARQTALA
jgi:hypothetical protein